MSLRNHIARLQAEIDQIRTASQSTEADFAADPVAMMRASGLAPDAWQQDVLRSGGGDTLLLVTRQGGKSTTTAGKALHTALYRPGSLVLLLSPSLRQSQELFAKAVQIYHGLETAGARPVAVERMSTLRMELVHGSRIIALPGTEKTIRGFSAVDLLIIDEAARVLDELYYSVRPMLAVSGGQLIAMTTPWGKRGFFYQEWTEGGDAWHRVKITAADCPRIPASFIEEERRRLPETWFRSEYFCQFTDTVDQVFRSGDIERAVDPGVPLLFAGEPEMLLPVRASTTIETLTLR